MARKMVLKMETEILQQILSKLKALEQGQQRLEQGQQKLEQGQQKLEQVIRDFKIETRLELGLLKNEVVELNKKVDYLDILFNDRMEKLIQLYSDQHDFQVKKIETVVNNYDSLKLDVDVLKAVVRDFMVNK
jgi:exonuclease VII small subunit